MRDGRNSMLMKYLTLHVAENAVIELDNSIFGKETVSYNGDVVSECSSFFGGTHRFEASENGETVRYEVRVSLKPIFRIGVDVYRNDKVVLLS